MTILEIQSLFLSNSSEKLGKRKRQFFPGALFHFLEVFSSIEVDSKLPLTRITKRVAIPLHFLRTCSPSYVVGLMSNV